MVHNRNHLVSLPVMYIMRDSLCHFIHHSLLPEQCYGGLCWPCTWDLYASGCSHGENAIGCKERMPSISSL